MIEWVLDSTGKWTDMQIDLKTGDNWNMVLLKSAKFFPRAHLTSTRSQ